jgi:hypothetical protein
LEAVVVIPHGVRHFAVAVVVVVVDVAAAVVVVVTFVGVVARRPQPLQQRWPTRIGLADAAAVAVAVEEAAAAAVVRP